MKEIEEAVRKAISEAPARGFKESVDLAINLQNIDLSQPANRIDAEIILPHGRGRAARVAVFAAGETALRAKSAGADLVLSAEDIKSLGENKRSARKLADEYEYFIAETQFMPTIGRSLGPILGKRGKMPAPLPPTSDVTPMVTRLRNIIRVRSRDRATFHVPVGSRDMDPKQLADNVESVIVKLEQSLKDGRQNLKSVYVKTTMGPAVRVI
ncbi:MAG: 50S ribosomal protein L1 [Methanosaeta sp. PtaB.Bin039]|nr:MAG: 50S ribosomal protein L1 [Methanosaeta sp. PtaB.Bin039]OPY44777.1 MAG: 50S ribosomal protein L1 [Methanosaeta sp. PtaU1.Bin028]HOT06470.1 50S ribosomal protein L1 [Methanotrichaceae archaeon]HQF15657.1 50S ribosomal protein L1 [Methanotrichaceae archaeon]HQI90393.1 50S ribosomal protein L1 [Methanotrichaceae archaeon]